MAVIGNPPAKSIYQSVAKQTITGTGDSSYSLDYHVGSPNEIEVFVNNVRQEPSLSYSVAGDVISFTEAIDSADDTYLVFQGKAATSTAFTSVSLGSNGKKWNLNGNITSGDLQFQYNSSTKMDVNEYGDVSTSGIFWENGQTVSANYTITSGRNAMSAGPITVADTVTVTVGAGQTWTVV